MNHTAAQIIMAALILYYGWIAVWALHNYKEASKREKAEKHDDLTPPEKRVFSELRNLRHSSIWGIAISNVCEVPDAERFRELIRSLKSQAADDENTMRAILGDKLELIKAL